LAKRKTVFFCSECGGESPVWAGRCPHCGTWNTMVEEPSPSGKRVEAGPPVRAMNLREVKISPGVRFSTGLGEFDRVLGGGAFKGSMILVGGEPGIGKSTLMLQSAMNMASAGISVLYAAGEESPEQVAHRARRIGDPPDGLVLLPATEMERITGELSTGAYQVLVVDSIQTMHSSSVTSAPGSVSQVRQSAAELSAASRPGGVTVFVIGHVTKEGAIAGPKVLEHLVDAVISFEGDSFHQYRLLRASKNRFGSTSELGVFEMDSSGLSEVPDASGYFLGNQGEPVPGSAVAAVMEGTRPFLVEIQALTSATSYGFPQRRATGIEPGRLAMLLAVLERRCGLELGNQDVYVNATGGFTVSDPGADLAVCMAVASSRLGRPVVPGTAFSGEVGLAGEIRPVPGMERRSSEAVNLGFTRIARARGKRNSAGGEIEDEFATLSAAMAGLLADKGGKWLS